MSLVEACIKDTKTWMTNNLKLYDDKTKLIIITLSGTTSRQNDIVVNIGDSPISPRLGPLRNLSVLFYSTCGLNDHLNVAFLIHNATWHFIILCAFCQVSAGIWFCLIA